LALKLWAIERKSHIMALVADEGLALFCGLNAMPKRSFLAEYSSQITPRKVARLLGLWHEQLTGEALLAGQSLNLDFHSVPYYIDTRQPARRARRPRHAIVPSLPARRARRRPAHGRRAASFTRGPGEDSLIASEDWPMG
jgi:hypothetical protein